MKTKTVVIYHKSDFDGIFCREIARKFMPEAELIGWEYGEPTPNVPPVCDLYILDLSIDELMDHGGLIWIDHHKTAIEKYPATIPGYRIDGVAACRLAWQWFAFLQRGLDPHRNQLDPNLPGKGQFVDRQVAEPMAVRLAGEYDIWDKRDPDAELFQHGLRSRELTESMWMLLLAEAHEKIGDREGCGELTVRVLLEAGESVAYAETRKNELIIGNNGFTRQWEGLWFLCCNAGSYNSHLFTAGIQPEHDGLLGFCLRKDGMWSVSLYGVPGKPDVDLSAIAKKYGGGGHKQACGFKVDKLPFLS